MMENVFNAPLSTPVRRVGRLSIYRGPSRVPEFDVYHDDDEGESCGHIYRGPITGRFLFDGSDATGFTGDELVGIGQFVNDLNEHYADKGGAK